MFKRSTFIAPVSARVVSRYFSATLLPCLLLLLSLSACKTASTPTQTQMPAQPQSQATEPGAQQSTSQSTSPARSDAEIIGDFDAELDDSIAVFDGMILEERAKAEAIEASLGGGSEGGEQGSGDGGDGGEGSLFEDGDIYEGLPGYGEFPEGEGEAEGDTQQASNEGADATGDAGDGSTGDGSTGDGSTDEAAAAGSTASPDGLETTRRGGIPEDIEGGSDDDIVARQIREAALQEKDPVLREKLWNEYRKYKNQ